MSNQNKEIFPSTSRPFVRYSDISRRDTSTLLLFLPNRVTMIRVLALYLVDET